MKAVFMLVGALLMSTAAQAADLGTTDLPRIHAEYKANQARWAREFLEKTFAASTNLERVSNVFGNDKFTVAFMENPSDWTPGVSCEETPPSDFILNKNKGDSIFSVVSSRTTHSARLICGIANFLTARRPQTTQMLNGLPMQKKLPMLRPNESQMTPRSEN